MITPIEYAEVLRKSTKVQQCQKIQQIQVQAMDYIKQQMNQLNLQYHKYLEQMLEKLEEQKLQSSQLKIQNENYLQLILQYETQSIQNKNYISLEIVNQLLCDKIKALLMLLKDNNIISELEFESQINTNQKIIEATQQNNIVSLNNLIIASNGNNGCGINQNNHIQQQKSDQKQQQDINRSSTGVQVNLRKKRERLKSSIVQEQKQKQKITIPDFSKEIEEFKKSISALEKSRKDLLNSNEMLKSQNKNLQSRIHLKQATEPEKIHKVCPPKVIMKFLKFDDIVYKQINQFSMAKSFDLKQGMDSARHFSTRPKSCASSSVRQRVISYQSPTFQICNFIM